MFGDYIPREKLLGATNGSIYKLTALAAKRAMLLAGGEKSLVEKRTEKLLDIALEEIAQKKIAEPRGEKKKKAKKE
ncbi:MAG: DNA-directed RNA polymerase subunit omega [Candidatus Omnitrophica bacterium]|nr:DNA-directed RNA polymerase subunit omega [Candidatus Omnitrophota bacterium]MCF7877565.1 DNA-directed RNA polymerase subunit omega [Candidatus Omnitrophota bacterium]MCF7877970.1 DNA-directed RNA polymerase subunit omega [Candidatus Omnitrophota bacterium]MCF7892717.1 DNA-directed RNA polymerase subunit omega [Candidatus Omnitrophota bacterium]